MDGVMQTVLAPVLEALATAAVAAFLALVIQLARRVGLDLSAQQQARVEHYARLAIAAAEEWAARQIKEQHEAPASADKLAYAIQALLMQVPGVSEQEAEDVIHASLERLGKGAAAFVSGLANKAAA